MSRIFMQSYPIHCGEAVQPLTIRAEEEVFSPFQRNVNVASRDVIRCKILVQEGILYILVLAQHRSSRTTGRKRFD